MDTDFSIATNTDFIDRLREAVRVMEGLSESQRVIFDIHFYAVEHDSVIAACIAGLCGLDPWFQERGFVTCVGSIIGDVSIPPADFFGTELPFYPQHYVTESGTAMKVIGVDDAIAALRRAILLKTGLLPVEPSPRDVCSISEYGITQELSTPVR